MKRRIDKIFVCIFIFVLVLPMLFMNFNPNKISVTENRYLERFPNIIAQDGKISKTLFQDINVWANDNIGFRDTFVNLNTRINYSFFKSIASGDVKMGKSGWLYLLDSKSIENYQNKSVISEEKLESIHSGIKNIDSYYNSQNIDFFMEIFPRKEEMYPEFMNNNILKLNNIDNLKILEDNIEQKKDIDINVFYSEFMKLKANEDKLLYSKAYDSSHWNNYGAYIAYRDIMNKAQKYTPDLKILYESDFDIDIIERETLIANKIYSVEEEYIYKLKDGKTAFSDKSFFTKIGFNSIDPWQSYNYFENIDKSLPKAIIVGDSYVWMFMLENFAESFSQLVFIHQLDIDNVEKIINKVSPDIVIYAGLFNTMELLINKDISEYDLLNEHGAEIVSHNSPTEVIRGKNYNIDIVVKNITSEVWSEDREVRLCIWQDGSDMGYRIKIPEGTLIKPGEEYTFKIQNFGAPPSESTYIEFQMVEEGITYFGEKERVDIIVKE